MPSLKIGELAERTDCQVESIRYYEQEKLLPEPARNRGNYRVYGEEHVERLSFIRNCRLLDMSLAQIRALLGFYDARTKTVPEPTWFWTSIYATWPSASRRCRNWKSS